MFDMGHHPIRVDGRPGIPGGQLSEEHLDERVPTIEVAGPIFPVVPFGTFPEPTPVYKLLALGKDIFPRIHRGRFKGPGSYRPNQIEKSKNVGEPLCIKSLKKYFKSWRITSNVPIDFIITVKIQPLIRPALYSG